MDWFRMYGEMIDDPKIGTLDDAAFRTWVELLCAACKAEDNGNTHLKQADLNWVFRRNADVTLQQLLHRELVTVDVTGDICITKWQQRQKKSDSSADRVRAHRAKAKQDKDLEEGNDTETLQKRSCNGLEKRREEKKRHTSASDDAVSKAFAEFWATYPKKASKPAAEKAYRKLNPSPPLQAQMLAAVALQAKTHDWTKDKGQYVPHAATWINNRRWEDQLLIGVESSMDRFAGAK